MRSHSTPNTAPLTANNAGTSRDGAIRPALFEFARTRTIDTADAAMYIVGNAV